MSVDRYTKVVLTVIAACLVWISLGGPSTLPSVQAQTAWEGQRVVITGWIDDQGTPRRFPSGVPQAGSLSSGLPMTPR